MENKPKQKNRVSEIFFLAIGSISLVLGSVGAILPGLPTTPFILLAAACFMRSSDRLYSTLKANNLYRKTVGSLVEKKGMTRKTKLAILIPVWIMLLAMFLRVESYVLKVLALFLGALKTTVFFRIRTLPERERDAEGK